MLEKNFLLALTLTILAGLSTGIGSLISFFSKKINSKFLSLSLGFSAGVMIYVSFVEIFLKARNSLGEFFGIFWGDIIATISFFSGIVIISLIDKIIPEFENPHEISNIEAKNILISNNQSFSNKKLFRMGIFSAIAIAIHNFPEGFATFMSSLVNPKLGISIAVAIAIHNIPEGIVVSVPIFYSTKNKYKAFWYSFISGLAEPLGGLVGYFLLSKILSESLFGTVFAFVAGVMVYISLDELLPTAEEYGEHHIAIGGVILGMVIMAVSLLVL